MSPRPEVVINKGTSFRRSGGKLFSLLGNFFLFGFTELTLNAVL